ncbi:hypothetical protein HPB50_015179 [Hyalomma asiaticum]|uniref:Uncharacterized protein n=1 Tax=Hyalomma asiaticum TaxID=266040 RepID=A0ACB7RPV1_HYAAI|nr:hypothetical protein HPB50_015179 [Hyalomma asiaticum]
MDPRHYDPRDWTQVLIAQANHLETRTASQTTNADASLREKRTQTQDAATAPTLNSSSTQLRVLRTVAQKIKQLPPLPTEGYKVVFRSQGGLDLTTLQPRNLLNAFMQAAALTETSTLQLRIHPYRHLPRTEQSSERQAMYRRRVENKSPHPASTKRTEAREDAERTGLSQRLNRPTRADKLKKPQMTTALQKHAPPTPDPRDQELRALGAEPFSQTTVVVTYATHLEATTTL